MLERIDKVVFYFTIDCAICHNLVNVSHVTIEEKKGGVECSLCGKQIKFPDFEKISQSAKILNEFLGDIANSRSEYRIVATAHRTDDQSIAIGSWRELSSASCLPVRLPECPAR